ncbi:vWA domain-containing protein [Granulosicoccus antarcticus]|uniref:VWFA domain-containing protein n=1 Tax=Granulosicoccus antarcticus IMCC3135 TaxID=1192854 RepID=A0A2Z2P0W3_9GAMM|nr:VWA domain-containing protein [Granulosicoccus antarcticus]ASJ74840.1 hypothetical protein IMCC3135_23855 [Granulosicoccus antarcticus IMCC3135]
MNESLAIDLRIRVHDFVRYLRANKLVVDPGTLLEIQSLAASGYATSRTQFRNTTRACACRSPRDWQRFDTLFETFWQAVGESLDVDGEKPDTQSEPKLDGASTGRQRLVGLAGTSEKQQQQEEVYGAGDFKALSLADFRFVFDARQMRKIEHLVEQVARRARRRVSRREYIASRGASVDLRKSSRLSLRYGGRPVELRYRRKKPRLRRFVLLLDISQSMDVYARLFMRFARILMCVFQRSDAYVFNTELSELGRGHARLSEADFERTLNRLGKGWLGGTRIAGSLESFNEQHLMRCVDTRTTVLIFSDGCDTDTPLQLAEQVEKIQRRAGKLVWVNPLLGRFEPGEADKYMDPVVPYVDRYCSAHNLETLIELERELLA